MTEPQSETAPAAAGVTIFAESAGGLAVLWSVERVDRGDLAAFAERSLTALLGRLAGRDPVGVELTVNFLGAVERGPFRADCRLVHRTRRTALVECLVLAGSREVVRASGTYLIG